MSYRIKRPLQIILLILVSFIAGYFNTALSTYFLNKDALIGLLVVSVVLMYSYVVYLIMSRQRLEVRNANLDNENQDLRRAFHADFDVLKKSANKTENEVNSIKRFIENHLKK